MSSEIWRCLCHAPAPLHSQPVVVHRPAQHDAARRRLVLFGGYVNQRNVDDTWEFDGDKWTRVMPATE